MMHTDKQVIYSIDERAAKYLFQRPAILSITRLELTLWLFFTSSLEPVTKKQERRHRQNAGNPWRGLFKHYWGESSRKVGGDNTYSLFLAMGIPFEVTDTPAHDGWTFLSDSLNIIRSPAFIIDHLKNT